VPVAQAKRGDLLFWGPGGSQHVAMYLGNGQMLEASGSAEKVKVSPVRTSGLQPYAARNIES
ncbi:MAG: NlpC/P60 family protein, partial [Mycobacterium sp.]